MAYPQKEKLRSFSEQEHHYLEKISRSQSLPAAQVARACELLAVTNNSSFAQAARLAGRKSGQAVAHLVRAFNLKGLAVLDLGHGGGGEITYNQIKCERILNEFRRSPERKKDGTATWSLKTLQHSLRQAPDGLPEISTYTIWCVLHRAGFSWQKDRSWCETGVVMPVRKAGAVKVSDPDALAKQILIERAYTLGEKLSLPVWTEDEAGPFQTLPYPGLSWQTQAQPKQYPHEYLKQGTAKLLTLFRPATGEVRVKGVISCTNAVLHPWLKEQISAILAQLPHPVFKLSPAQNKAMWESWQAGLTIAPGISEAIPPLRLLLVLDNLAGHHTPSLIGWLAQQGIMPLFTPLGGSWLNLAESIQRILKRRGLDGQHPTTPTQIIEWLEETAEGWNRAPTVFEWGGKRKVRRQRAWQRRHALGGSGGYTLEVLRRKRRSQVQPLVA